MSTKVEFKNLVLDKRRKTLEIEKGSKGEFPYTEIAKCNIRNEDAKYTGKSDLFSHTVVTGLFQPWILFPKDVYVGIEFIMSDQTRRYVYISDEKVQIDTLKYHDDRRQANDIKEVVDRIIHKYHQL